jgi:hypothetical protein
MRPAVAPVETDLTDDQPDQDTHPHRPCRDRGLEAGWDECMRADGSERKRRGQQQARHQATDEKIPDIDSGGFAKDLLRMQAEEALERQEYERE